MGGTTAVSAAWRRIFDDDDGLVIAVAGTGYSLLDIFPGSTFGTAGGAEDLVGWCADRRSPSPAERKRFSAAAVPLSRYSHRRDSLLVRPRTAPVAEDVGGTSLPLRNCTAGEQQAVPVPQTPAGPVTRDRRPAAKRPPPHFILASSWRAFSANSGQLEAGSSPPAPQFLVPRHPPLALMSSRWPSALTFFFSGGSFGNRHIVPERESS